MEDSTIQKRDDADSAISRHDDDDVEKSSEDLESSESRQEVKKADDERAHQEKLTAPDDVDSESTPDFEADGHFLRASDEENDLFVDDVRPSRQFTVKEDTPLIGKDVIDASQPLETLERRKYGSLSIEQEPRKMIYSEDRTNLELIHAAEQEFIMSSQFLVRVGGVTKLCRDIATAIYLDDVYNMKRIIQNKIKQGIPFTTKDIQRRMIEAVELNSLKCLEVLCELYEDSPISSENDMELLHRRYGLSFWPVHERPKESALHVLAGKFCSIKAMEVLERRPRFLDDFADVQDGHGSTPLLLAIKCNNIEVVKRLLLAKPKPEVDKKNHHDETPIHVAALNGHADVLREILKTYSGPDEKAKLRKIMKNIDGIRHSIFYPASESGKPEILYLLVEELEESWWKGFLEKEKTHEDWEQFAGNVCAAGCKPLVETILNLDKGLLDKTKARSKHDVRSKDKRRKVPATPLMRAAEANNIEIVKLIFSIHTHLQLFTDCDDQGRNVFHYAVKNPDILAFLLTEFITLSKDYKAINKMDNYENTPIKLAAVGNQTESFGMLLEYTTNKVDIFSRHLMHHVGQEVLEEGLHTWTKKDPKAVAILLKGDHEEHQPFLDAARRGNEELVEFFLQKGANHQQRTPNDQTAVHYAVLSGSLPAVKYLLAKPEFLQMIDFLDEVNVTAAGYATQRGHAEILRCLLDNNAQMKSDKKTARLNILDSAYGYFKTGEAAIREIVLFCTRDGKIKMLRELFEDSYFGPDHLMAKLIEETPNVAMEIFNKCVYPDKHITHRSYSETKVEGRVTYTFFPFKRKNEKPDGKLEAIDSMVNFERDNCLGHPLVLRFLNEKLNSSSIHTWFLLNILLYTSFLVSLTVYGALQSEDMYSLKSPGMIVLSVFILILCAFHFIKEIFQLYLTTTVYFYYFDNYIEWLVYICAVVYVAPGTESKANLQIALGAISVFLAWINFSLFLKRFSLFGIYIIMAKRVFLTVCKVLPLVILFIAAFALSFSLLMPRHQGFGSFPISMLTAFVMMTGELDYRDTFLASDPLHVLHKLFLVLFILMISISVMNLLTALAVGDTNEIMNRSREEKRINKATLVLSLERTIHNLPLFSMPKIEDTIKDTPETKKCSWLMRQWRTIYDDEVEERLQAMVGEKEDDYGEKFDELREEIKRTKELIQENANSVEINIENRLRRIEEMVAEIHARGVKHE